MNRWLVSGVWLSAVLALVCASTKGALGVAALWALPAALGVTVAAMGWPEKRMVKAVGVVGIVWQMALIGAYWPFAAAAASATQASPMSWPTHALVIMAVLLVLALSFVALFVIPALSLRQRISRAAAALHGSTPDALDRVGQAFRGDVGLSRLWQEYLGQVRPVHDGSGPSQHCAHYSARAVFDPSTVTHSRLRLEFFRNLPGVFTGIGIIGTFSGLIMGLRSFHISQDPSVVQRSLEALLSGVWEAFLVSAVAIALAILVTVIEKFLMSSVYRQLDALAGALDGLYPPRPQPEDDAGWMPKLLEALKAASPSGAVRASPAPVAAPAALALAQPALHTMAAHAHAPAPELNSAVLDAAQQSRVAMAAMTDLARALPELMASQTQAASLGQAQVTQALKSLSARMENVAASIELSGRKTLETVAARLMQSEMNMVSRHHAVADHLGELVQRIEALCGLLQQDRADSQHIDAMDHSVVPEPDAYASRWGVPTQGDGLRSSRVGAHWSSPPSGSGFASGPNGGLWPEKAGANDAGLGA
jgi:hypothetical protein